MRVDKKHKPPTDNVQAVFWQYCVLCLSSCNKLEEGDVVEKWYEPTLFP